MRWPPAGGANRILAVVFALLNANPGFRGEGLHESRPLCVLIGAAEGYNRERRPLLTARKKERGDRHQRDASGR